jgi:hypothetical protein
MLYSEFLNWIKENKPSDMLDGDFLEFCALIGVLSIQNTLIGSHMTIDDLIDKFFDKNRIYQ